MLKFYSRTDVCQRSFFFGRMRPCDPDVCSVSLRAASVQTEHPFKAEETHMLHQKAAKGCHPRLSAVSTGSPRTHVWCPRRASALLSVGPASGAPRVAPAPVLTVTQQNIPHMRLMRRLTLHIVRGSARSDPAGGDFTRTATPNGAHRGSGSQWGGK